MQFNISKTFGDNKLMTATILLNPETLTYRKVSSLSADNTSKSVMN